MSNLKPQSLAQSTIRAAHQTTIMNKLSHDLPGRLPEEQLSDELSACCIGSATRHGPFNTMLACGDCKNVLKVFRETGALQKYLKFCASTERKVITGVVGDYLVVAFSF